MNGDGKLDVVGPACIGSSFVTPRGVTVLLNTSGPGGVVPPGAIAGKVKDMVTAKGIAGAKVDCGNGGVATTLTTGNYKITNLPPARYTCTASKSGYTSQSKSVTVQSGQTAPASFKLRKA
jgi:hypothetical protein